MAAPPKASFRHDPNEIFPSPSISAIRELSDDNLAPSPWPASSRTLPPTPPRSPNASIGPVEHPYTPNTQLEQGGCTILSRGNPHFIHAPTPRAPQVQQPALITEEAPAPAPRQSKLSLLASS